MANRRRPKSKPIGLLPKGLWIAKPLLFIAAVFLVIDLLFLCSLETSDTKPALQLSIMLKKDQHRPQETTTDPFRFDKRKLEAILAKEGPTRFRIPITAYLEPPLKDIVEGTINQGDPTNATDVGTPPRFVEPLPTRNHPPDRLKKVIYPNFQTCHGMPSKLPVDRGLVLDSNGKVLVWNTETEPDPTYDDSPHCPVDQDPHLPWIHDIVPSSDGSRIHFVAQNKRRCQTGTNFRTLVQDLTPQASLFQPISVKRLTNQEAKRLEPDVYHDETDEVRYRLADYSEADDDAQQTRFRCIFTATNMDGKAEIVGETLSIYPFNYEFVSWRRMQPTMLNPKGTDKNNIYTATLLFDCPVPDQLQSLVASGDSVLSDGTPTLRVNVIPIRTSPRYGLDEVYFTEAMAGPKEFWHLGNSTRAVWRGMEDPLKGFDAKTRWGTRHVLPPTAASGRWTNLPICKPTLTQQAVDDDEDGEVVEEKETAEKEKPFELVACVWASASYATRGINVKPTTSSLDRISEWLEFALLVGFDHIYVYDNSAANHPTLNLKNATDRFEDQVTRIQWDHASCNNNQPGAKSPGERSSQYAAENSCRIRFGNLTKWMASFDLDEFLIPMGSYDTLKQVTRDAAAKGHNIIDFRSTRSKLRLDASEAIDKSNDSPHRKKSSAPFLEAYNCDTERAPKPYTGDRARKEIYRTDHVLYHFVHYSLVSKTLATFYKDGGSDWVRGHEEIKVPEHQTDEANEAVMLHAKSGKEENHIWKKQCKAMKNSKSCVIGIPWPRGMNVTGQEGKAMDRDKFLYNCYENPKVTDYWLPKLKKAMTERVE